MMLTTFAIFSYMASERISPEKHYVLIGQNIENSRSPDIYAYLDSFFEKRIDYQLVPIDPIQLSRIYIHRLSATALGGNITIPYKGHSLFNAQQGASLTVRRLKAMNVFKIVEQRWLVDNTDTKAIADMLRPHMRRASYIHPILIGAGGAARAAAFALSQLGFARPEIWNRRYTRRRQFMQWMTALHFKRPKRACHQRLFLIASPTISPFKTQFNILHQPGDLVLDMRVATKTWGERPPFPTTLSGEHMLFRQALYNYIWWNDIYLSPKAIQSFRGILDFSLR